MFCVNTTCQLRDCLPQLHIAEKVACVTIVSFRKEPDKRTKASGEPFALPERKRMPLGLPRKPKSCTTNHTWPNTMGTQDAGSQSELEKKKQNQRQARRSVAQPELHMIDNVAMYVRISTSVIDPCNLKFVQGVSPCTELLKPLQTFLKLVKIFRARKTF